MANAQALTNATALLDGKAQSVPLAFALPASMECARLPKSASVSTDMKALTVAVQSVIRLACMGKQLLLTFANVIMGGLVAYAMCLIVHKGVDSGTVWMPKFANVCLDTTLQVP